MDLRQQLGELLQGRACLMGLGNVECADDGFGVRLAEHLMAAGMRDVMVAGTSPEDSVGRAADGRFDSVVFLDATEFGAAAGSVVLMTGLEISARYPQISTHKISIGVLAQWIQGASRTKVWLLGVQPESVAPGAPMTSTVQRTMELLRTLLLEQAAKNRNSATAVSGYAEECGSAGFRKGEAVTA